MVGHFVFTNELLPLLLATAKETPLNARVMWIASNGHAFAPKGFINFKDVNLPNASGWTRYGQSKAVCLYTAGVIIGSDPPSHRYGLQIHGTRITHVLDPSRWY